MGRKLVDKVYTLKDTAGADISGVTGSPTSQTINLSKLVGVGIQTSGTSVATIDVQVSNDESNWLSIQTESSPTLPNGIDIFETNFAYMRVVFTTGDTITCVVSEVVEV